ncbi:GTPase activator activity protein [Tritrichomonas musculus]|uniref:GTPase activator activity protein n=1 Tax=Tritrichomonas musculus TaxID=1915356 RepID=A0ABR2KCY4_9EUKA
MSLAKVDDEWVPLQIKVFTRWVKSQLKNDQEIKIEDITKDLSNGVALVELAKMLTQKELERQWCSDPKRNIEMVQNCDLAIEMFEKDGVKLVGISGKDINDNNQKLILGLIWSLILRYSISKSIDMEPNSNSKSSNISKSKKDALLSWAIERTSNYPNIKNFTPYDLSLCALLDSYFPEKINYYSLNPNETEHNSKLATQVMDELGIPVFVYPEDITNQECKVDDKTLLTQLSTAKVILDQKSSKGIKNYNIQERSVVPNQEFTNLNDAQNEIERLRKALAQAQHEIEVGKEENMKLQNKVEELTKVNEEIEDEKFSLEREYAKMRQRLSNTERQNKDDNELLQKLSIELTEEEYGKMEESDQNEVTERNVNGNEEANNGIIDTIVSIPKAIVKTVMENINDIEKNIESSINNNDTTASNNNDNNGEQNTEDTYSLSILDCENSRYLV